MTLNRPLFIHPYNDPRVKFQIQGNNSNPYKGQHCFIIFTKEEPSKNSRKFVTSFNLRSISELQREPRVSHFHFGLLFVKYFNSVS